MSMNLFRRAPSVLAALALTLVAGSMAGYGLSFAATAPAAQPAPAASPFGKLTPLAPVAPTAPAAAPAAAGAAAPAGAAAAGGTTATPRIIVIDRNFIMQRSAAGKDMLTQTQNLSKQAETQFRTEEQALQNEAQQLQQQLAILAADVRDQKEKEFVTKQQAFQTKVQQRQAEIQNGFNKAARVLEVALEPILQTIMRERGANMVLDRGAVIIATSDIDVTPVAVQRLDKVLPRVKVELSATPAAPAPGPVAAGGLAPAKP